MMFYGNGIGGWTMMLMTVTNVLFWGLVIAGIVALVRYAGRRQVGTPSGQSPVPQQLLAERFARGEIDEDEYRRRLEVLSDPVRTRGSGG